MGKGKTVIVDEAKERAKREFQQLHTWAIRAVVGIFFAYLTFDRFRTLLVGDDVLRNSLSVGLLIITGVIALFWLWSPSRNIELAADWLGDPSDFRNRQLEWISVFSTAILFSLLFFLPHNH